MDLYEMSRKVNTMEDFLSFLKMLIEDFRNNRDEWENISLVYFLDSMYSWVEDVGDDLLDFIVEDGADIDNNMINKTTLRAFAGTLLAAKTFQSGVVARQL